MADFASIMRRIVTGDDSSGRSLIIIDGPPSASTGDAALGGLFDIWHETVLGPLDPKNHSDLGPERCVLSPGSGQVKARWFVIQPRPPGAPAETLNLRAKERFRAFDAEDHLTDQARHPAMHRTQSLDIICLLQGEADLILDTSITRIKPGQIVIQRGTSHAWEAHGGPALLLAVLIDRPLADGDQAPPYALKN